MTGEKFDKIVKARANERVQEKIIKLKQDTTKALQPFGIAHSYDWGNSPGAEVFDALAGRTKWPRDLWEREEIAVAQELLGIMDEMQRALIAVNKERGPDDVLPEDPPAEK